MILSNIVNLVNAKSFGETTYTYEEIYPYFLEAVNAINGEIDSHRHIPGPPSVSEYSESYRTLSYTALSDMHIANFIVTYIVVAMDNASLSVTSRTQTYASQLEGYKRKLISDLYRWMPITTSSNSYFDLTGDKPTLGIPNVGKVWYDESEGGMLSSNSSPSGMCNTLPTIGVHCENPYGYLVPRDTAQKIKEGLHSYEYVFYPTDYFKKRYTPVIVHVAITGYDIPFSLPVRADNVYDVGTFESLEDLVGAAWSFLKSDDGTALVNSPSLIMGSVKEGHYKSTHIFVPYENGIKHIDELTGIIYKITKQSNEFVYDVLVDLDTKLNVTEFTEFKEQNDIALSKLEEKVDIQLDSSSTSIDIELQHNKEYSYALPVNFVKLIFNSQNVSPSFICSINFKTESAIDINLINNTEFPLYTFVGGKQVDSLKIAGGYMVQCVAFCDSLGINLHLRAFEYE